MDYTYLLEREYDREERHRAEQIEREKAEGCCPQCDGHDEGYIRNCDNCGKPIPLSEAGALCEECDERAEQERLDGEMSEADRLGELPHGGWRRS